MRLAFRGAFLSSTAEKVLWDIAPKPLCRCVVCLQYRLVVRDVTVNIKIFVCCHQPVEVPRHPLLVPLQVGAALADKHFPGFLHDDVGDNISYKNRSYCELTGQYWGWKNVEADYYGFFHYRRYLYPDIGAKLPYKIRGKPSVRKLEKLGYSLFAPLISQYDVILPQKENMHICVRDHYATAPYHHGQDLSMAEQILLELFPNYAAAVDSYLSGTMCYFGNIFIMRRQVFQEYCGWLFPILERFDRWSDTSDYSMREMRVDGYLAERLLGVYLEYFRQERAGTILELPRVHFYGGLEGACRRVLNVALPPGSGRRARAKKVGQNLADRLRGNGASN